MAVPGRCDSDSVAISRDRTVTRPPSTPPVCTSTGVGSTTKSKSPKPKSPKPWALAVRSR